MYIDFHVCWLFLSNTNWRIRAFHYKAMRLVFGATRSAFFYEQPQMKWPSSIVQKCWPTCVILAGLPSRTATKLHENCLHERRYPWRSQFFENGVRKIGNNNNLKTEFLKLLDCLSLIGWFWVKMKFLTELKAVCCPIFTLPTSVHMLEVFPSRWST